KNGADQKHHHQASKEFRVRLDALDGSQGFRFVEQEEMLRPCEGIKYLTFRFTHHFGIVGVRYDACQLELFKPRVGVDVFPMDLASYLEREIAIGSKKAFPQKAVAGPIQKRGKHENQLSDDIANQQK